jgi:ABC-type multidrug transport system ATPase subunit
VQLIVLCRFVYRCGCSDPEGKNCLPSNNLNETQWAGQYTVQTTNPVTGQTHQTIYSGWAQIYGPSFFECPDSLYCPGNTVREDSSYCPQLCDAGFFCPTPSTRYPCTEDSFCLIGSTEPTPCTGLERCPGEGNKIYNPDWGVILIVGVALLAYSWILLSYRRLNKLYPFRRSNPKGKGVVSETLASHDDAEACMDLPDRPSQIKTPEPAQRIDVSFADLQLTLPNGRCIMQGVCGSLNAGQFTAIMGPSGAGKSTFLSLLSGKNEPTGGTLHVNGKEASLSQFRPLVGFVPQEDIMLRELTVEENIRHSAFMRLPADWTPKQKLERVYQVMESLDLLPIKDSIIGDEVRRGISGGQRKRVNVAMELVADPSLLALDEPTSGLDSTTSHNLTETLHNLARTGVNVAAVLHQPKNEIFEMFDNVLLLGVGGRTVYLGPAREMTAYFTGIGFPLPPRTNPADYYMDVVAGLIPCDNKPDFQKEDLFDLWIKAPENLHSEAELSANRSPCQKSVKPRSLRRLWSKFVCASSSQDQTRRAPGFMWQTYLMFQRAGLQRIRVPQNTFYPILLSAFAALINGLTASGFGLVGGPDNTKPIYYGVPEALTNVTNASSKFLDNFPIGPVDNVIGLWQNTALIIMLVSILSVNVFGGEQAVFNRDASSGTNPVSYWLAKTLETFFWLPVYTAVFAGLAFLIQPLTISLLNYWIVSWMTFIGFHGIGMFLSLLVGPANRGIMMLVTSLILILVFTGLLFPYGKNENPLFMLFFPFWTAQGYCTESYSPYDGSFDVELFNLLNAGYDLSYSFIENMVFALLTGLAWHILALLVLISRK